MKRLIIKEFVIIALISGLIGVLVAMPIILNNSESLFLDLLGSFAVGMSIGIVSLTALYFVFRNIGKYTFWTFCLLTLMIGSGTFLGAYLMGERSVFNFLIMILPAELIGNSMAAVIYKRALKINERLKVVQEKFSQQR
ncbi:MAG: hypothetical protein HOB38_15775 [Deltaproteobacteria bacterium]|jgi:hypothetical protein|nr:hypothetical protein [Deltaproteobacteria bacterium]MBT4266558.1 hypothetical protein [Deltaproteobacteria bacterium]MBT4641619.1 hypothetical protein [Deltaproteobacteria bacterium]MBT6613560.1 hypothetical protein [Deltaproteobacteria bacterium]